MITVAEMERRLARTPWWTHPTGWHRNDPDLMDAGRAAFEYSAGSLRNLAPGGLYLLRGPRRVGKTVEVKKAIRTLIEAGKNPRQILHLAADGLVARDLRSAVAASTAMRNSNQPRTWFIDEITAIEDGWPSEIKWLRDNDAGFRRDTVVLTGSSAAELDQSVKALAGRRGGVADSDRVLLPMSFRAFVEIARNGPPACAAEPLDVSGLTRDAVCAAAADLIPWTDSLVRGWEAFLVTGGFPRAVDAHMRRADDRPFRRELLDVVHGEALRRARWSKAQSNAFVARLAAGIGAPANHMDIATDIGGSATLVRSRLTAMQDALIAWPCHRERRDRPMLHAQSKAYLMDPVLARLSPDARAAPAQGLVSEQQLGIALLRSFERVDPGSLFDYAAVLYHRTPSRKEIDFVGPRFGGAAIESKYVSGRRWRRALPTLKASRWRGIVATRDTLDLADADVFAVPTGMLAWLIGG